MPKPVPPAAEYVADYPRAVADWAPRKAAIIWHDTVIDFTELDRRARAVAEQLVGRGIRPGDRVAYIGANSPVVLEVFFGILRARATFVPISWRLAPPEQTAILLDARPRFAFADAANRAALGTGAVEALGMLGECVVDDPAEGVAAWYAAPPSGVGLPAQEMSDEIMWLYTSGSTGAPKAVLITNATMHAQRLAEEAAEFWPWLDDDVVANGGPLFNISGLNASMFTLSHGATCVLLDSLDPDSMLETTQRWKVTQLFAVPAVIDQLCRTQAEEQFDVSSLRIIHYGTAPISPELIGRALTTFECGFIQHYGSTEACGSKFLLPPADHTPDSPRLDTCGKPMAGVEVRVVDSDGDDVPVGEPGELLIRTAALASSYMRAGEQVSVTDADGWFATGDIVTLDDDGFCRIVSRKSDVVNTGGYRVYPAEVELLVSELPEVRECAVIGIPDDRWGEAIKVIVALQPGAGLTLEDIRLALDGRLARYKLPKSLDVVDSIPRLPVGKVDRPALRAPYWASLSRQVH
jgi:acyl-CoA synthetase (AMP-forming)/AMP-acid ligase II